ncbi:MAG: glycosyltransferase family 39 protein [Anaerolineae bacterium]|nr:glycosyltransferase family 39 protein [Anaerolineae bacterium]
MATQGQTAPRWQPVLAALVVILAMGLRFYRLDTQSFWNDEGNTARLVERPIALIIEGAAGDIHPPGYYLLLHGWRALTGHTEFALRSYSAFCGLAMAAVGIALGRLAGGWATGLIAGLCIAVHPLAVYYSQEARMYAQLGLVTAMTLRAAVALVQSRQPRRVGGAALALAACIALGLYTQYTYILALVGMNLAFGARWLAAQAQGRPKDRALRAQSPKRSDMATRRLMPWVVAHALGGALFLPWAPIALGAAGWQPPDLNQGAVVAALGGTLFAGTAPASHAPQTAAGGIILAAGGLLTLIGAVALVTSGYHRRRLIGWASLAMAVVPGALIAATGIYRPAYLKFLMMSVVPLAVTWALPFGKAPNCPAQGNRQVHKRLRLLAGAALLPALTLGYVQIRSLDHLYHDPALARDDYRGIAAQIRAQGRAGDAVVLNAPNQWEVFTYYYGAQPGDTLPVYPAPYRPTEAEAAAWVTDVLAQHPGGRLFALFWGDSESDPARHIEKALAHQAFKAGEVWVTTVRLAQYGVAPAGTPPTESVEAHLGAGIVLRSFSLPAQAQMPGTIVPLTLTWEADRALAARFKVFVHLVDGAGNLRAQVDMEPQAGFAPTSIWQPGSQIVDRYGLALPADLVPGNYTVLVGMYSATGDRLPVKVDGQPRGDALRLAQITIGD